VLFFKGLGIKSKDIYQISKAAADISHREGLLYGLVDHNSGELISSIVVVSNTGKQELEHDLVKKNFTFDFDMFMDLTAIVEVKELINSKDNVYMFLIATKSNRRLKGMGSKLNIMCLSDMQQKGYQWAYGETVNSKSESIAAKLGANLYDSINYSDYEFKGKKLNIVDPKERQTGFAFDLRKVGLDSNKKSKVYSFSFTKKINQKIGNFVSKALSKMLV